MHTGNLKKKIYIYEGPEVLTVVSMEITLILYVMACGVADRRDALLSCEILLTLFLGENIFAHIFTHLSSKFAIKASISSLFVTHRWQGRYLSGII